MTDLWWVGGSATWNSTPASKWATSSGGAGGAAAPTAADNVYLDANSGAVTVTLGAVSCRSLTCTGFTGTLSHPASTALTIGDGTAGAGNVALKFVAGMTYTLGSTTTSALSFVSTSATVQTVTWGGKVPGNVTFNGAGGKWQLADTWPTSLSNVTLTTGQFDTNGQTCSWNSFASSNSNVRTLTLGSSAINITGASTSWNIATATNLTITVNTATITLSAASSIMASGVINYNGTNVVLSGSGPQVIQQTPTFGTLTRIGTAVKTDILTISNTTTVTGAFTVTGNSTVNRVLVQSNTVGSARTISAGSVSLTNVDFMDITGAGAATWSGTSLGDCLGNSGITFDASVTQTHTSSAGGNWSDATKWTSRVPLPQDDVIVDVNTTGTLTADMPRMGKSVVFTGFVGTFTNSIAVANYGDVTLASGMTVSGTTAWVFSGRGAHTITSAGRTFTQAAQITAPGGSYTLADDFACNRATTSLNLASGTFTANGFNLSFPSATASFLVQTGTVNAGSGTWSFGTNGVQTFWTVNAGVTFNHQGSTIVLTTASVSTRTFSGGGKTYDTLRYIVAASPGPLVITGANTFNTLDIGPGRMVTFPASTVTTVTNWNAAGTVNGYLRLPGVVSNYASAPDSAPLSITGDIDLRIRVAMDDWTPAATSSLINKNSSGSQMSYDLRLLTDNRIQLLLTSDGSSSQTSTSTAQSYVDGSIKWIRVTYRVSDQQVNFYSADGALSNPSSGDWTLINTTTNGATSIFDSTSVLEIGTSTIGAARLSTGNFYRAQIRNNILDNGTGIVFDADFTTKTVGANSFTESSSNAATVTINGTLAQAGDGRVAVTSSTPGTQATISKQSGALVSSSYLSLQDSKANGVPFYAPNSVDVSGNAGWTFTAPPVGLASKFMASAA